MKIQEINLYTVGDSNLLSTWSNVPYLFAQALISKGIKVNRINIGTNKKIEKWYNKYILKLLSIFYEKQYFSYERSFINRFITNQIIRKHTGLFPNSQLNIFMSLSFYNKYSKKPSILFGDWTYEYIIKERQRRKPYWFENNYIKFQSNSINCADMVVSLFPKCCEYIKKTHENSLIVYLNQNVVNNCSNIIPSEKLIDHKYKKHNLLFIGGGTVSRIR